MELKGKINKCLKCGNTASLIFPLIFNEIRYGVRCDSHPNTCSNSIKAFRTEEEAINTWNKYNSI